MTVAKVHSKWVNGNLVYYQDGQEQRWLDVVGPAVVKVVEEFQFGNYYFTTTSPKTVQGWLNTFVEAGAGDHVEALVDGADGGVLLITTAGNDNDGVNKQCIGEAFNLSLTNKWPAYFGIRFKVSDATESDWVAGLCITDVTLTSAGTTYGVYFRSADASAVVSAVIEENTTETTGTVHTMSNNTYYIYEFLFDGTSIDFYVDGVAITQLATTNIPDTEYLTPSFEYLNGAAGVDTVNIDWIRAFQIQE